jgi:hypothetical protein
MRDGIFLILRDNSDNNKNLTFLPIEQSYHYNLSAPLAEPGPGTIGYVTGCANYPDHQRV